MKDQEDKEFYMDCIHSFDSKSRKYSVDIHLRGEFDEDEEVRRTIEESTSVMLCSPDYDIEPLDSKFVPYDEGYRNKSVFQVCPREGIDNPNSKVEVVLLICNEPIHRTTVDITDLLQNK